MEQYFWVWWTLLGVGLAVAEIFTLGFFLLWFGIGAIAAAVVAWLGFGLGLQFLTFAIVSIVLTALTRTIFTKYFTQDSANDLISGSAGLPGKIGTVVSGSKGALNAGEVKVFGSTWTAFPIEGELLKEGEKVEVVSIQGSSISVRKHKELPTWRESE